jgi:hypothetical protein
MPKMMVVMMAGQNIMHILKILECTHKGNSLVLLICSSSVELCDMWYTDWFLVYLVMLLCKLCRLQCYSAF